MAFDDDIKAFTERTKERLDRIIRASSLDLFSRIVQKTPVDTGRARANWQIELNAMPDNASVNWQREHANKNGKVDEAILSRNAAEAASQAINEADAKLKALEPSTRKICICNNVDYITELEYGKSVQAAPYVMVRQSVQEFPNIVASFASGRKV